MRSYLYTKNLLPWFIPSFPLLFEFFAQIQLVSISPMRCEDSLLSRILLLSSLVLVLMLKMVWLNASTVTFLRQHVR